MYNPLAFIHRFGSSLNEHVHFHLCAVDVVFDEAADPDGQGTKHIVIFHPAGGMGSQAVEQAREMLRKRILRAFSWPELAGEFESKEMLGYRHS